MKYHLFELHLNQGGYDRMGCYFGVNRPGERLYEYYSEDAPRFATLRANNREEAKSKIRAKHPDATFYR